MLLLEARDRVGGRIFTVHNDQWPVPIECGAEFIHGQPPAQLGLLAAANQPYYDMADTHWHFDGTTLEQRNDFWEMLEDLSQRLEKDKANDRTLMDFLEQSSMSKEAKALAVRYVEGFDAADAKTVGTQWIRQADAAEEALGEGMMRIPGGYDQLVNFMRSHLPAEAVRLNSIVKIVRWRRGEVSVSVVDAVTQESRTFGAKQVLITLPLGVLQASPDDPGAVVFEPPLHAKQHALSHLGMGGVVKITLHFREPFWQQISGEMNFMHDTTDLPIPTWWAQLPMHANVLTGWVGGPGAARLSGQPAKDVLDTGLMCLAKMTNVGMDRLRELLVGWHVHDWLADPFARGAYSFGKVGGAASATDLAQPIDGTLFFAGEATGSGMVGTVEAAIVTGRRAANEILHAE